MSAAFGTSLAPEGSRLSGPAIVHGGIGVTILTLMLWRLTMRLRDGVPPPPGDEPTPVQYFSRGTHYAFYGTLIAMPPIGLSALLTGSGILATIHSWSAVLLICLAFVHISGAIWHLFQSDGVVHRMARQDAARVR